MVLTASEIIAEAACILEATNAAVSHRRACYILEGLKVLRTARPKCADGFSRTEADFN